MKITVINGNNHHGSTWNCMNLLKQELSRYEEVEMTEFFLPKDMPHFCTSCFSCFFKGELTCPHAASVSPIISAMEEADVIIITSSVYALDVTGQLKALLDHLCFMWFSHRPNPKMFNKVGLSIVTTAGAGLSHTTKTIQNSLKFWGLKKTFSYKIAVSACKWDEVPAKTQSKIKKQTAVLAKQMIKAVRNIDKLPSPLFRKFIFVIMTAMMKKNAWNQYDRDHWEAHGWLNGGKPF